MRTNDFGSKNYLILIFSQGFSVYKEILASLARVQEKPFWRHFEKHFAYFPTTPSKYL